MSKPHETDSQQPIGESTPVRLGIVVLIVSAVFACLGLAATGIWWASSLTSDVRSVREFLLSDVKPMKADIVKLQSQMEVFASSGSPQVQIVQGKISDIAERLHLLEIQGSPAVGSRLTQDEAELRKIREDFDLHRATTMPHPNAP